MSARRDGIHLLEVGLTWPSETFLQWKFRGLVEQGFKVTVASSCVLDRDFHIEGVRVVPFPGDDGHCPSRVRSFFGGGMRTLFTAPERLPRMLRMAARAARERHGWRHPVRRAHYFLYTMSVFLPLAPLRCDVIHFEWGSAALAFMPMLDVWRRPMVISVHGQLQFAAHSSARRRLAERLPIAFDAAAAVHCVSDALREEAKAIGLDPAKAALIRSAVDPAVFRPAESPRADDGTFRIVVVAWLRWLKGIEYAVSALRELVDAGVPARLDVFGGDPLPPLREPSDRQRILQTVEDLGLGDHVRLHGHVGSERLVEELQRADVLLHPSLTEGIPTVILEAMSCGLPVVATDCGGVREAVTDGVEGFVVPTRDASQLAARLEQLWREPGLGAAMGAAGRRRVEADFALAGQVAAFARLYESVTAPAPVEAEEPVPEPVPPEVAPSFGQRR